MRTAAIVLVAAGLLGAALLRTRTYLRTRTPGAGYLMIAASFAGLAILLNAPGLYVWCDRVIFDRPNSSVLVSHLLTVLGASAAVEMVAALGAHRHAPGRRWWGRRARLLGAALVLTVMLIAFVHGAPAREDAYFFEHYSGDPQLRIYWCVFFALVAIQLSYVAALTLRFSRHPDKWLRRGQRLIGYGCLCAALFLLTHVIVVALPALPSPGDALALAPLIVGGFLLAAGVVLPQVGLRVDRDRARRRLQPLWTSVTDDYPQVRAGAGRPNLYRAVIEIQDALAEARTHRALSTPTLIALDALAVRAADDFDATVRDLLDVAARLDPPTHANAGVSR